MLIDNWETVVHLRHHALTCQHGWLAWAMGHCPSIQVAEVVADHEQEGWVLCAVTSPAPMVLDPSHCVILYSKPFGQSLDSVSNRNKL
jgi:hypothetical protein